MTNDRQVYVSLELSVFKIQKKNKLLLYTGNVAWYLKKNSFFLLSTVQKKVINSENAYEKIKAKKIKIKLAIKLATFAM